ncbi:MAG: hypothetical protein ACK4IT_10535 [Thioalkalivibrionaceae bacterium]
MSVSTFENIDAATARCEDCLPKGCTILPRKMVGSMLVIAAAALAGSIAQDGRALGAVGSFVGVDHWFLGEAHTVDTHPLR